jgi:hypothetical protein
MKAAAVHVADMFSISKGNVALRPDRFVPHPFYLISSFHAIQPEGSDSRFAFE